MITQVTTGRSIAGMALGIVGAAALASCAAGLPTAVPVGFGEVTAGAGYRQIEFGVRSRDGVVLAARMCLPPAEGHYAAVVFHFGSDRWGRLGCQDVAGWTSLGMASVTYDKRGTGQSQGTCCPYHDAGYFPLLAADVESIAATVATHPEVDPSRLGAYGFSQGGWVIPVAAADAPDLIRWTLIGSGPAVTLGEELHYSDLTGDSQCAPSGRTPEEIEAALAAAGRSGFDPLPYIARMTRPGLWIYGALDTSIPVARSVANLTEIRGAHGSPFTIFTIPGINHSWIVDGAMCQLTGNRWDDSGVIVPWLRQIGMLPGASP